MTASTPSLQHMPAGPELVQSHSSLLRISVLQLMHGSAAIVHFSTGSDPH